MIEIDTADLRNLLNTTAAGQEFGLVPDVCYELLNEIDRLRATVLDVLQRAAILIRPCKRCGEMLYFVRERSGAFAPYTADGRNHFANCPHAQKRAATQEALFDAAPLPE